MKNCRVQRKKIQQKKRDYIIQPYVYGNLFHCELIVRNGEIQYSQARKYSYPNFSILSGKVIASFPVMDKTESNTIGFVESLRT